MQMMKNIQASSIYIILILFSTYSCYETSDKPKPSISTFKSDSSSMEPYLYLDSKDRIYASWIESKDIAVLKFSMFENDKWSKSKTIASGADWFVNWADYPIITSDGKGNLLSHYLRKSAPDTYSYNIYMVISNNDGQTWEREFKLNSDSTNSEHGFVSAIPYNDGFLVSWLDGRNTVSGGPMSLRTAHFDMKGNMLSEWLVDERVCDCCQTSLVMSKNGPMIAYRDREENEVRDIAFSILIDDKWTAPATVFNDNWKINGCPVNGPRLAANKDWLAISWFTSPDGKNGEVKVSIFDYDKSKFKNPILLSHSPKTVGRVDIEFGNLGELFTIWVESDSIKLATIDAKTESFTSKPMVKFSSSRKSGFPQMVVRQSQITLLYTNINSKILELLEYEK